MRINEIFYSIQGEGYHSGRPAVFVRFSGCNLKCPFCDTAFQSFTEMKESEVVEAVEKANTGGCRFVVLTGGEPTMQLTHSLVEKLHDRDYYIAMESNGAFRDGNEFENPDKPMIARKKIHKESRYYQPNTAAAIFLLSNLSPEDFVNRQRTDVNVKETKVKQLTMEQAQELLKTLEEEY